MQSTIEFIKKSNQVSAKLPPELMVDLSAAISGEQPFTNLAEIEFVSESPQASEPTGTKQHNAASVHATSNPIVTGDAPAHDLDRTRSTKPSLVFTQTVDIHTKQLELPDPEVSPSRDDSLQKRRPAKPKTDETDKDHGNESDPRDKEIEIVSVGSDQRADHKHPLKPPALKAIRKRQFATVSAAGGTGAAKASGTGAAKASGTGAARASETGAARASETGAAKANETSAAMTSDSDAYPLRAQQVKRDVNRLADQILRQFPPVTSVILLFVGNDSDEDARQLAEQAASTLAARGPHDVLHLDATAAATSNSNAAKAAGESASPATHQGLSDLLLHDAPIEQVIQLSDIGRLYRMPTGIGILSERRTRAATIGKVTAALKQRFKYTCMSVPAESIVTRAFSRFAEGVYLCMDMERADQKAALMTLNQLRRQGARVTGSIVRSRS